MKINALFLFSLLLVGSALQRGTAQQIPDPKRYDCYLKSGTITIDGILDDPAWQNARWSEPFTDIQTGEAVPTEQFTRFKMLWDRQYCYIAACLAEPHIWDTLTAHDAIIYHENDFEVFIDPDGDAKNYYEFEINALGTVFDLFLNKPYKRGGTADIFWNFKGIKSATAIYGTPNNPNDLDSRWTVEIAIPWSALNEKRVPENNEVWRFNFSRVEWPFTVENGTYTKKKDEKTGNPLPEDNWVWSTQGKINMHLPERWGKVRFVNKPANRDIPRFWVWSGADTSITDVQWQKKMQQLSDAGITGLLLSADTATLHRIALLAACFGIETHAWFWTMNRGDALPQWLSVNLEGKSLAEQKAYVDYYKFMCPALPEVRRFLSKKIDALTRVRGISGIHFDYIRYVDAVLPKKLQPKYHLVQKEVIPRFDYGYHPYLRSIYKSNHHVDPLQLSDPLHDTTWFHFRLQVLDTTVWMLRDIIKSAGLTSSAAVFPTPEISRSMVRQNWTQWKLDYYFPMVYHNFYGKHYAWIKKGTKKDKKAVGNGSKIFCGLFVPALKNGNALTKAIQAALKGGADGIAFFNLHALDEKMIRQIKAYTSTPK